MNTNEVKLKQRSPLGWLFLSLLVPYAYFYWLHSSRKQIDQLNRQKKTGRRIKISPWWLTGLFSLTLALLITMVTVAVVGEVDVDKYSSLTPSASAQVGDHDPVSPYDPDPYDSPIYYASDTGDDSRLTDSDDFDAADGWFLLFYLMALLVSTAFAVVQLFHLLQHTDGIVGLVGDDDKAFLIVMSAVGCFVLPALLVAVVYKSQSSLNQAIAESEPSSA